MKKSKIVSYTSEELKQMTDESDWVAADAMTDEEIEAAIASDPEEAEMHAGWMKRGRVMRRKPHLYMCVNNKGYEQNLTIQYFLPVALSIEAEQTFKVEVAQPLSS